MLLQRFYFQTFTQGLPACILSAEKSDNLHPAFLIYMLLYLCSICRNMMSLLQGNIPKMNSISLHKSYKYRKMCYD